MASAALAAAGAAAAVARRARRPAPGRLPPSRGSAAVRRVRRDLHLDGYPVHGPGYYWSLSKCSEFVKVFMPIADDVSSKDIIYSFSDWTLKLGIQPEKGDMVIDDKVLYKVDMNESYFVIDDGEYGERCVVVWLCKYGKETDWYAYDRFSPVWERFLLEGEKRRADLTFKITDKAYLDIAVDGKEFGRVVLGLYGEICPRTVKNFLCLCTGEKGEGEEGPLHYKDTRIHRVVKGFCIQGGQTFETEDGDGGESIYGGLFEDENLRVKFRKPGIIGMANGGPDTNGSQFFITTVKADHISHKCVAFGEVLEGFKVVSALESLADPYGEPTKEVTIADCGVMEMTEAEILEQEKPLTSRDYEEMGGDARHAEIMKQIDRSLKEQHAQGMA